MKTEAIFKMVNAKNRLPEKDKALYITLHKPICLEGSWELSWKDKKGLWWMAKEQNQWDVYWLEQEMIDVPDNIDLKIDDGFKLTFDVVTHELIKVPTSAEAEKV
jgi:hypothetical protein